MLSFCQVVLDPIVAHVALFDYKQQSDADISMRKGDKVKVIDKSSEVWWKVRNMRTQSVGFVPASFITSADDLSIRE
jgi:hypothetical protein